MGSCSLALGSRALAYVGSNSVYSIKRIVRSGERRGRPRNKPCLLLSGRMLVERVTPESNLTQWEGGCVSRFLEHRPILCRIVSTG